MEKNCLDCSTKMIEVRKALAEDGTIVQKYPQIIPKELNRTKYYTEYRFYCENCKKEWVCDTKPNGKDLEPVPENSEYIYSEQDKMLILSTEI